MGLGRIVEAGPHPVNSKERLRPLACVLIPAFLVLTDGVSGQKAVTCAADLKAARQIAITGTVRDSVSDVALMGAQVYATVITSGSTPADRSRTIVGSRGVFRICFTRMMLPINVHADFFGRTSRILQVRFGEDADSVIVDLAVLMLQKATVSGRVLDAGNSRPVSTAQLRLQWGDYTQLSDATGRFFFPDVPPGRYELSVTRIGYTTFKDSLTIDPGASLDLAIRIDEKAIALEPLTVTVRSRRLERAGFYDRQRASPGSFVTRADIDKLNPSLTTDLLRNVRGVRLQPRAIGRGFTVLGRGNCRYRYFIDGVRISPGFDLDDFDWQAIEAMEVYRGTSETPPQFSNTMMGDPAACGVIVIWTRIT